MDGAYHMEILIRQEDIDELSHVNNVVYLQWVQDISRAHWFELSDAEMRERFVWVVLKHEISYLKAAKWGDALTGTTWVGETGGFKSVRHVEIRNGQHELLASAQTVWCLLDAQSFKPTRITNEIALCLEKGMLS